MVDNIELDSILLDMEDMVNNASRIPLSGKVLVDGDSLLECIDKIHALLPEEIKQAKQVLAQSDKLLESIESQGKKILEDARAQASRLVMEDTIVQQAQAYAAEIEKIAKQQAMDLRNEVTNYSQDILHQLELNLEKAWFSIKKSREDLENQSKGNTANY